MKTQLLLLIILMTTFINTSCNSKNKNNGTYNKSNKIQIVDNTMKQITTDTYLTNMGDLKITLVGHASLIFEFNNKIIHVDPYSKVADYETLPKADLIILTHEHSDHMDVSAINKIKTADTRIILSKACNDSLGYGEVMNNGDKLEFNSVNIEAVPAYNVVSKRPDGEFYHPKGRGNGYIFTFGDKKIYVAGDTENIPEMKALKDSIYIAFLPKNIPYTMTDDMFIDAAKTVNPTYLYPYHLSEYNEKKLNKSLNKTSIKVMLRPMSNK